MDRFIAFAVFDFAVSVGALKSNMDRFIGRGCCSCQRPRFSLKSNMDRFIARPRRILWFVIKF